MIDGQFIGGSSCACLLQLEKFSRKSFLDERNFEDKFLPESEEDQILFEQFRHAVRRSQTSFIKGVYFFEAFCKVSHSNYRNAIHSIELWCHHLGRLVFECSPVTIFIFSRMFVNMSEYDFYIEFLLLQPSLDQKDVSKLIRNKKDALVVWENLLMWRSSEVCTHEMEQFCLRFICQARSLNTIMRPHDIIRTRDVQKFELTNILSSTSLQAAIVGKWRFLTRQTINRKKFCFSKWQTFTVKQKDNTNQCQKILAHWSTVSQNQKNFRYLIMQTWKERVVCSYVITCWVHLVQREQFRNHIVRRCKKWRKKARKMIMKQKKQIMCKLERIRSNIRDLYKLSLAKKYFSKWKLMMIQSKMQRARHALRRNNLLLFSEKRSKRIASHFLHRWKSFVLRAKMHQFVFEKYALNFFGKILHCCMDHIGPEMEKHNKTSSDLHKWCLTQALYADYSRKLHEIVEIGPLTHFVRTTNNAKLLSKHSFPRMFRQWDALKMYSAVSVLFGILNASFERILRLFVSVSHFAPKKAITQVMNITSRFRHVPNLSERSEAWIRKHNIPAVFGKVAISTCEAAVTLWFEATNKYIAAGGTKIIQILPVIQDAHDQNITNFDAPFEFFVRLGNTKTLETIDNID